MDHRKLGALALLLASLIGCTGPAEEADAPESAEPRPPPSFDYPKDDALRLHHLQLKGTHNSYHIEKEGNTVPHWRYTHEPLDIQLAAQGVRAFELDTQYNREAGVFEVFHIGFLDELSTCPELSECFAAIASFSDAFPAHHPIIVQIEPKDRVPEDDPEGYFAKLEETALSVFARERIITPDEVQGSFPTLREAILERGWPALGELRGRVLFYIDDAGRWREAYTRENSSLEGRLFFVDSSPEQPFAAVRVLNDPVARADEIRESVEAGFLVRTRSDSDGERAEGQIEAALSSGAHIISTDFPVAVDGRIPPLIIPGGTPSRCNPITAPAECGPEAIENPAFMSH